MTTTTHRLQHAALGMPAVACGSAVLWGSELSRRGIAMNGFKPINGSANVPFAAQP